MNAMIQNSQTGTKNNYVAVVGMACRYPGGVQDAETYWSLLLSGKTGIVDIPADRWSHQVFYSPEPDTRGKMRTRWGGFLAADVFGFDPAFFDMSPREVTSMDPQQRLLLQIAFEAVQDSGLRIKDLQSVRTGVFVGMSTNDFSQRQQDGSRTDIFAGTGTAFSIAANRVSHRFDLKGPSMTIDTACSSALVAVDQAVNSILAGDCDMALAGGVNCMLDPRPYIAFSTANMLSPTGAIYTFDSRANGFVRGEGCGLVLLKPLVKAIADGDRIYGIVRQTAVNQDGHTKTLTSPSGEAQEAMLRSLMARADVAPADVGYVEAHGTGTPIGDPIEATAIGRVFGEERAEPVWVGSFKPNLGHLESGSGIAGFMKAVLTVYHGTVPPNRNFSTPNPAIAFDALGIRVPVAASGFATDAARPRMAVVNSFGFGGTNASALVQEWRAPRSNPRSSLVSTPLQDDTAKPLVIPVSSGGSAALQLWAGRLASEVAAGQLADVPVAAVGQALWHRDHLSERAALVIRPTREDLAGALTAVSEGREMDLGPDGPTIISRRSGGNPRLALAFSGQGGQWWGMSRRLIREEPVFRRTVDMVGEALKPLVGWTLIDEMLCDEKTTRINEADRTQGSIFANQIGLYEMWKARGIVPELLIGHSFGEIAATYVAGVLDLDTVARIIAARGRIPFGSTRKGAMATLGLTVDQLTPLLPEDGSAVIAAYNGPVAQTVAGMEASVDAVMKAAAEQYPDAVIRRLTMNFGWHSEHLDDCEAAFRREVGPVAWKSPALPIVSTVTGVLQTRFDLDYWWDNLRQPVSYTKAVNFCFDYGIEAFLEIGPHRTLTPLIRGIAQEADRSVTVVNSLDRKEDDYWTMARAEAQLFVRGVDFAPPPAMADAEALKAKLPMMPWANQHLSSITPLAERFLFEAPRHALLGRREPGPEPRWSNELLLPNFKFIADHRVNGDTLFPAVGYLEVMGAALRDHYGHGPVEIRDFRIHDALSLAADDIVEMRTELDPRSGRLRIFTEHRGAGDGWRLRAEAYGWRHDYVLDARPEVATPVSGAVSVGPASFYGVTRRFNLEYGPHFRQVDMVWRSGDLRMRARLKREPDAVSEQYFAYPGTFDGILQACILFGVPAGQEETLDEAAAGSMKLVLPVGARRILLARPLTPALWVEAERHEANGEHRFDFAAYDDSGEPLLLLEGLETRALGAAADSGDGPGEVYTERYEAALAPAAEETALRRDWFLIANGEATAKLLTAALAARGATVRRAALDPVRNFDSAVLAAELADFCRAATSPTGVLFCWDSAMAATLLSASQSITEALVTVARAIGSLPAGLARPKLAVVSRQARLLPGDPAPTLAEVAQSAIVGLARTISNEMPDLRVLQVDADAAALAEGDALSRLVMADGAEPEYLLRTAEAHVVRLEKEQLAHLTPAMKTLSLADRKANFRVTMSNPGIIDNIRLRETARPEPAADEVIVEVAAVGLNFRDVMAASGILPDELTGEEAYWNNLGLEFAGTVVQAGADVEGFAPGDRVMGMGKGFLRRYAKAKVATLMRVPAHIDLKDAASMPVAYLTAHYSLVHVGRVEAGERVLVQLASGGVGLAAIQVCRHLGAEVMGTAGSDEKRDYLRKQGLRHVMNSRTLDFAREVRLATNGQGVDVVLNALSGAGIDKSLECLAPFGRLVEIGKRDLADDKPIGLKSLYWNNSYAVVDLSTLPHVRPQLFQRLVREVEALIAAGAYGPLNATRFPVTQAAEALRTLARARHIGKVIVTFDTAEVSVEQDLARPIALRSDGAYLVTGGLKGFGAQIGAWASACGAGKVILANRAGKPDAAAAQLITEMEARGTRVECVALDVSEAGAVEALVAAHASGPMPLRGIFHAAAVIEDAFLTQLDRDKIRRVLAPKVAGAEALDAAVRKAGLTLDHFVMFSSVAQLIGSPGQANYTAANSVLNAFASYRGARHEAANAVAWGMIGGSGFVARSEAVGSYLDSMGIRAVADRDAANALGALMRAETRYAAFAKVDWAAVTRAFPSIGSNPKIKPVLENADDGQSRIQAELMALPRSEWEGVIDQLIRGEVARVLKTDTAAIAVDKKLTELGLDSLSSFELKNRIEAQVEVSIPVARFLQAPTIAGLSKLVAAAFESKIKAGEAAARVAAGAAHQGAGGAAAAFRPLTRQFEALLLASRPMTSPLAAEDLVIRASATSHMEDPSGQLHRLARAHDALSLAALKRPDGSLTIELGEAPSLHDTTGGIVIPGPLWRFEAIPLGRGQWQFSVLAHRAAADALSVQRVLRQWIGEEDIPSCPASFAAAVEVIEQPEDTSGRINDLAYWKEIMMRAPRLVAIDGRRRAAAPAGFGINRGDMLVHEARIAGAGGLQEAELLAAYVAALGKLLGESRILVERHTRWASPQAEILVGPITASHPVVVAAATTPEAVSRLLASADRHAAVDTAVIESVMAEDLRLAGVSLRQFGFALAGASGRDLVPLTSNEVLFSAAPDGADLDVVVAVDTEVMPEAFGAELVECVAESLRNKVQGTARGAGDMLQVRARGWLRAGSLVKEAPPAQVNAAAKSYVELPVTINQSSLLRALSLPGVNDAFRQNWIVGRGFKVTPQLDIVRLSAILTELRNRHEAMRTRFVRADNGSIQALLFPAAMGTGLTVETCADAAAAEERARAVLESDIDPYSEELFQVHVFRVGSQCDVVVARGHHVILDAYSLGLLVEEMMQLFLGMSLPPVEIGTQEYIKSFDLSFDDGAIRRRDAYLADFYAEPALKLPGIYKPGFTMSKAPQGSPCRTLASMGTPAGMDALQVLCRDQGVTIPTLMTAALGQAIGKAGQVDETIFIMHSTKRHDARLRNFVNWAASDCLVRVPAHRGSLPEVARSLGTARQAFLGYAPIEFIHYEGALHDEIVRKGSYSDRFQSTMLTGFRGAAGALSSQLQKAGAENEIDLGFLKLSALPGSEHKRIIHHEIDMRSFETGQGAGFSFTYNTASMTDDTARSIFEDVLGRLGLGGAGVE